MKNEIKTINLGFVNAFLLKADDGGFILVDTGMPQHLEKLKEELKTAGCVPGNLKLIVATHGDQDHIGNCAKLKESYSSRIAMHEADSSMIEKQAYDRKCRGFFAKFFDLILKTMFFFRGETKIEKFFPDLFLEDGRSLLEFGIDAKVIHIPGHTKGSIGILFPNGDFIAGDTLGNMRGPDLAIFIDNYDDLKKSIEKLMSLGIKKVYSGHGKPFDFEAVSGKRL